MYVGRYTGAPISRLSLGEQDAAARIPGHRHHGRRDDLVHVSRPPVLRKRRDHDGVQDLDCGRGHLGLYDEHRRGAQV
jgi:hypothetical protein